MHPLSLITTVFQLTLISSLATQSTIMAQQRTNLTILYLTDVPLSEHKEKLFAAFVKKVSNSTGADRTVKLQTEVLQRNSNTLLSTLRVLNDSLVRKETGIIILDVEEQKLRTISLFKCFGLVFDIGTRPTTEYKIFPTITMKPSLTRLHSAVKNIFGQIGWTTMAEVDCYSQLEQDIENMKQALDTIKRGTSTFIFVKCLDNLDLILKYGKEIGLTSNHYRWVFPGIVRLKNLSGYLPKHVIGIDLPGSQVGQDSTTVQDALFLNDVFNVLEIILNENSQKWSTESEWGSRRFAREFKRYTVNRSFRGHTGDVFFDEEGRRGGEIYKIFELITFEGEFRWLPIGSLERGNVKILFNQWRLDKQSSTETPELRVVTLLKDPWVTYASDQIRSKTSGECIVGRLCRHYTNVTNSKFSEMEYEDYCCTGLILELLQKLETDVGFRGIVHIVKDGKFGSNDPKTHRWNGMIGEVVRGEADMALSTLTITAKRSKVVDFTYPYLDAANGILVSTEPKSRSMWQFAFLETFSVSLWLTLFITVQIVIVILWLAERLRKRRRFFNNPYKRDNSISYAEIINYTWSLVFQKASEEVGPSTLGGRTVAALFAFCTIIACSSFTANLAAIKVSHTDQISISGIHDSKFQHPSSDFIFGTLADSANLDFFRDSEDPAFRRIYKQIRNNLASSSIEGAHKVAKREWSAYIDDIPELKNLASNQTDCKLKIVGDPFFFSGYGIVLQKNSHWNTRISLVVTELVRTGFVTSLLSKWLPSSCGVTKQPDIAEMGMNDIGGAFLIVAFGCIASGVFLGIEFAVWRILVAAGKGLNEGDQAKDTNQTLNALTKVFTMLDINKATTTPTHTGAKLSNFRTLTQRRHLGD